MTGPSPAPDLVRFHPSMAKTYRTRIGQLIRGMSHAEDADEAKEALRALIDSERPVSPLCRGWVVRDSVHQG